VGQRGNTCGPPLRASPTFNARNDSLQLTTSCNRPEAKGKTAPFGSRGKWGSRAALRHRRTETPLPAPFSRLPSGRRLFPFSSSLTPCIDLRRCVATAVAAIRPRVSVRSRHAGAAAPTATTRTVARPSWPCVARPSWACTPRAGCPWDTRARRPCHAGAGAHTARRDRMRTPRQIPGRRRAHSRATPAQRRHESARIARVSPAQRRHETARTARSDQPRTSHRDHERTRSGPAASSASVPEAEDHGPRPGHLLQATPERPVCAGEGRRLSASLAALWARA